MRVIIILFAAIAMASCTGSKTVSNDGQLSATGNNSVGNTGSVQQSQETIDLSINTSNEVQQLGKMPSQTPSQTEIKDKNLKDSEKAEMSNY